MGVNVKFENSFIFYKNMFEKKYIRKRDTTELGQIFIL